MNADGFQRSAAVHFFIRYSQLQLAYRRLFMIPRVNDRCVFNDTRYAVERVEWCLDEDATETGIRVNIELVQLNNFEGE